MGDLKSGAMPEQQPGSDLEYDLAHEAGTDTPSMASDPEVHVVTDPPGYDGDYSYDLAHDIPAR